MSSKYQKVKLINGIEVEERGRHLAVAVLSKATQHRRLKHLACHTSRCCVVIPTLMKDYSIIRISSMDS